MHSNSLGTHTFPLPEVHPRHPEWLSHFTPRERHELIEEDRAARNQVFMVMAAIWFAGLLLVGMSLWAV